MGRMYRRFTVATLVAAVGLWALIRGFSGASLWQSPPPSGQNAVPAAHGRAPVRADRLIPARIRRLSNAEYDGTVAALVGTALAPGQHFAPDARQAGFTENEAQRVDAVLARQLFAAAEKVAADSRGRFAELAPCATPADAEACARSFIAGFGARAYRRPLVAEEAAGLLGVYREGARDAHYEDGIELVIRALLQSAGMLYLTELGDRAPESGGAVALTDYEIASLLSYLMTGAPPDQNLFDAAAAGELDSAAARRSQLQRLRRDHTQSRDQLVRMVREWLQIDAIENTAKDIAVYPSYELLRKHFISESQEFIAAVLDLSPKAPNDLRVLLGADWTIGNATLGKFYDAQAGADGRLKPAARRGILNQGAFLSVQAHAREGAPVLRGAVIARRLACIPVPAPQTRGIKVLPPPPDPKLTTRERFALHSTNPVCAECHDTIDAFGNAFEQYDGMGGLRATEHGSDIDSTTEIDLGLDFDGTYKDSNALAEALANSQTVHECFARYMFRAATARSVESGAVDSQASEDAFIAEWRALPEPERGNIMDTLDALVSSRLFTHRRAPEHGAVSMVP